MTLLPPNTDPTDGTSTPSGAGPESQSASLSCPNNGPTWAVIAAGGEACFIEAIRYSNALPASAPPYQIYITGALTFDGVTRFIPDMRRGLEIWGNNSWFTVSADNPLTFLSFSTGEPYLLSHLRITNEGNKRNQAYGGAIRNAARLRIYDSVFDNNAAENGGGAILSSAVLPNPPSSLHLERVHFTNNRAGGGGAIQMDYGARLTGDCVMFENNSNAGGPPGGYGQSVLLGSFGGSVSLTRSGMRTRYVTFAGGGTYPQLYNLTTAAFTVSNNYIKAAPQPPL
jgi:predicted outer membrane repeat protein